MKTYPTFEQVLKAHKRIKPYIYQTPVLASEYLNRLSGAKLFFKCENFQKSGAFKLRGAANAVLASCETKKLKGVIAHSSGNHGTALACIAGQKNIPSTIVVPHSATKAKKEAIINYGGKIIECEVSNSSREKTLAKLNQKNDLKLVHPYNDADVIAGQATCAYEFIGQTEELDALLMPIGGGGLASGSCISGRKLAPQMKIYGAEPQKADDAYQSLKSGKIIAYEAPDTIADGLRAPLKDLTWYFVSQYIEQILLVTEEEICSAMKIFFHALKIIIEPSSAVPLAAVLKNKDIFLNKNVGIIITGANLDLDKLTFLKE